MNVGSVMAMNILGRWLVGLEQAYSFNIFFKKLSLSQKSAGGTGAALQDSNVLIQHSRKAIWMMNFFPII